MNWLSDKNRAAPAEGTYSGKVSSGLLSVIGAGETRDLEVCVPGGYCWKPRIGQSVIVVRTGAEGEAQSIIGCPDAPENTTAEDMEPGEVYISSTGGAYIYLKNNGEAIINGQVFAKEEEE